MPNTKVEILRLLSVTLSREKQLLVQEEINRYSAATNWVIKSILKDHLQGHNKIRGVLQEDFSEMFDKRPVYLDNVIKSARAEIIRHNRLAATVRSMRDKIPFFESGRMILSQPIVKVEERAVIVELRDRTQVPIPYDKRSRNKLASKIEMILKGDPRRTDASLNLNNKRYERVRFTWKAEGFVSIDIRAVLPKDDERDM